MSGSVVKQKYIEMSLSQTHNKRNLTFFRSVVKQKYIEMSLSQTHNKRNLTFFSLKCPDLWLNKNILK